MWLDIRGKGCSFQGPFGGVFWKCVAIISAPRRLPAEEAGRPGARALLFVRERLATRVGSREPPRLGIRMSLSDFPSLVTFRDAAFRLISRWMLLVTSAESVSHRKAVSQIQRRRLHKGFSCREKFSDHILSVTRRENSQSLCVQLDNFFPPLSVH